MIKQAIQHTGKQNTNEKTNGRRAKKRANLFKNHFRSGGEENDRQMANNVMQETRVYDGYLVCLDLA